MSNKHPKPGSDKPHTQPHQNSGQRQECKWDGNARVSGKVEIKLPEDLLGQQEAARKDNAAHNNKSRLINWLTLAAVVIYAGLTAWQACETHKAVEVANTANANFLDSERPWMGGTVITPQLNLGDHPTSQIGFNNSGKSPAKVTDSNIQSGFYAIFPRDPEAEYSKGGVHGIFISTPGGQLFTAKRPIIGDEKHPVDYTFTPDLLAKFNSGKETFFIFGKVEYSDVYGVHNWWTHICAQYVPPSNPLDVGGFAQCREYNDAR